MKTHRTNCISRKPARKNKHEHLEASKILLIISDLMSIATMIATFVAVFSFRDLSPLIYLIPAVFGLSSVAHGFYYWKAKAENLHKYDLDKKNSMSGTSDGYYCDDYSGSETDSGSSNGSVG